MDDDIRNALAGITARLDDLSKGHAATEGAVADLKASHAGLQDQVADLQHAASASVGPSAPVPSSAAESEFAAAMERLKVRTLAEARAVLDEYHTGFLSKVRDKLGLPAPEPAPVPPPPAAS